MFRLYLYQIHYFLSAGVPITDKLKKKLIKKREPIKISWLGMF